jgi:hypothetical protein
MRDPDRIENILECIRVVWRQDPDLRLGQLILNSIRAEAPPYPSLYYLEDDKLKEAISAYAAYQKSASVE